MVSIGATIESIIHSSLQDPKLLELRQKQRVPISYLR